MGWLFLRKIYLITLNFALCEKNSYPVTTQGALMESKSGILKYIGWVIRIVVLLLLIVVIALFVVRLVKNKDDSKKADQAAHPSSQESNSEKSDTKSDDSKDSDNKSDDNSDIGVSEVPSGVADSTASNGEAAGAVPQAGMSTNLLTTAAALMVTTYVIVRLKSQHKHVE